MRRIAKFLFAPSKKSLLFWFLSLVSGITSLVLFVLVMRHQNFRDPACTQTAFLAKPIIILGIVSLVFFAIKLSTFLFKKSKHILITLVKILVLLGVWGSVLLVVALSLIVAFMVIKPDNFCVHKDYGFVGIIGQSMAPTYEPGTSTYAYLIKEPLKRGCIVVADVSNYAKAFPKLNNESPAIKRIIAIPGDSLAISRGDVYLNGKILNEPYIKEPGTWLWPEGKVKERTSIVLSSGEYFIMGDNRNHSGDSRLYGPIMFDDIIGYTNDPKHPELNTCH